MQGLFCGIDPGKKGGVALVDHMHPLEALPLPYLDKAVDVQELSDILTIWSPDKVFVELQQIQNGQAGAMTIGANYGRLLAVLELLRLPYAVLTPATWKRKYSTIEPGMKGKQAKEASFYAAKVMWGQRFDDLGLRVTQDGPVEALLIAEAGRRS